MTFNDTLSLVSLAIGQEAFEDLLMCLPDAYFDQQESTKASVWRGILAAVNRGVSDPQALAALPCVEAIK